MFYCDKLPVWQLVIWLYLLFVAVVNYEYKCIVLVTTSEQKLSTVK